MLAWEARLHAVGYHSLKTKKWGWLAHTEIGSARATCSQHQQVLHKRV